MSGRKKDLTLIAVLGKALDMDTESSQVTPTEVEWHDGARNHDRVA